MMFVITFGKTNLVNRLHIQIQVVFFTKEIKGVYTFLYVSVSTYNMTTSVNVNTHGCKYVLEKRIELLHLGTHSRNKRNDYLLNDD